MKCLTWDKGMAACVSDITAAAWMILSDVEILKDAQTTDEADVIENARTRVSDSEGKPSANHVLSCSDLGDRIGQFSSDPKDQFASRNKVIPGEYYAQETGEAVFVLKSLSFRN